jgi:hypothetical protein
MLGELADLPVKVTWLSSMDNLPTDAQTGQVVDYIAVISLGNIHLLPDGTAQVATSYNTASAGSVGKTYTLAPKSGDWVVTGEVGG